MTPEQEKAVAQVRREQLQRDINSYKQIPVDRSIYHKTEQDLAKLFKLKNEWKVKLDNGYIINTVIMAGAYTAGI